MTQPFTRRLPLHPETDPCLPRYAVWEVTLRCDQACHFCGTRAGHARDNELTTDEALEIIRQLSELGTQEIALHGGEAYLRSDFFTIVRAIHDRGIHCTMVTGGRGMTPEVAREAKAAGIHAVSVSVDGTEATHDRLRGLQGSHAGAMRAMAALRDAGIKVGCNTQVNKQNYRELPALAELIHAYPIYGWQVQLMVPMGRAADAEDLWLQPYDMLEVIPIITDTRTLCDRIGIKLWPGDNVGYFGPCEHVLRKDRARGACPGGCGGGVVTIGIEATGDIKGCSAMATEGFVAGNIRQRTIKDLWENAPELRMSRDFKVDDLWGFCRSCYYAEVCKGGCIWTASTLLGKRGNNPYCYHRALELLGTGKRERLTQTRKAAGLIRDRALFEVTLEDAPPEWVAALPKWQPS